MYMYVVLRVVCFTFNREVECTTMAVKRKSCETGKVSQSCVRPQMKASVRAFIESTVLAQTCSFEL